jgi:CRISPR-associated exonuclease Cas4
MLHVMQVTGTHIAYFHLCHRKLWLFTNGISMEHTSDAVSEGKLIGETTYNDRAEKFTEIEVDGVKIDFYDARRKIVHEVKKSNSVEYAHIAQVKYYLYKLHQKGVDGVTGLIEYPKLKKREEVFLTDDEHDEIRSWEQRIGEIAGRVECPMLLHGKICNRCSYEDFCYSD